MRPLRVLHLEDDANDAFIVKRILERAGLEAEVKWAETPEAYLEAISQGTFDVILADNGFPGYNGLAALEAARSKQPDIPFICVSGSMNEEQALADLNGGASGFVSKEHLWQLISVIRQAVEARKQGEVRARLDRQVHVMSLMVGVVQELSLARDLAAVMAVVRRVARELTGADGATFVLREGDQCYYAEEDAISPLWKGQRFPMSLCISGWVMQHGKPAVIEDIYADPRIPADAYRPTFVKSLAMVPIRTESPIGAIGNYWARRRLPTAEEVGLLQILANTTSVAMENVQLIADLEKRVKDRTIQLESANRELEAFSYSVSHDLRAPLRAVSAFTELLAESQARALDDEGKHYVERIRTSCKQMGALINDLLRLAKVVRTELNRSPINLSQAAEEAAGKLRAQAPDRNAHITVQPGLTAEGDPGLIRVVLENLLSNAWKYTSQRTEARIEFGAQSQPDGTVAYYVKDNGAGFDMRYVGRLFAPFQRLHRQEEFAGTGVGLATVQRIVHRHGGRIWAEGEVDKGATFYFTLA